MPQISARTSAAEQVAIICDNSGAMYVVADALILGYNTTLSGWSQVNLDPTTLVLPYIDFPHHEIHEGDNYDTSVVQDIAAGASALVVIVTPDTTKWAHMLVDIESESEADFQLFEGVTYTAAGTAMTAYNHNRNSSNTAGCVVTHTPDTPVISSAKRLSHKHWGASAGVGKSGGTERSVNEWILKQNTKYLIVMQNPGAGNNQISISLHWYEHTNE